MKEPLTKNVGNRYPCEELSLFKKIRESVSEFIVESSLSLGKNRDGKPVGFCGIIRNSTEREIAEKQLSYMAYHDESSVLHNRKDFLENWMKGSGRLADMICAVPSCILISTTLKGSMICTGMMWRLC
jgi:hypothetical protein